MDLCSMDWFISIYFFVLLIFGAIANGMVVKVFLKKERTKTSLLLVSIAISDILPLIFSLTRNIHFTLMVCQPHTHHALFFSTNKKTPFDVITGTALTLLRFSSGAVSTYSMLVIAFMRYKRFVLKPFQTAREPPQKARVGFIIGGIWLVAILLSAPAPVAQAVEAFVSNEIALQVDQFLQSFAPYNTWGITVGFLYVIPVSLTGYCYLRIVLKIRKYGAPIGVSEEQRTRLMAQRKRLYMLIVLIVCVAICMLPDEIFAVLLLEGGGHLTPRLHELLFVDDLFFPWVYLCNPVVYYFYDTDFHQEVKTTTFRLKTLMTGCFPTRPSIQSQESQV